LFDRETISLYSLGLSAGLRKVRRISIEVQPLRFFAQISHRRG
jgi:hypothetical protein